MKKTITQKTMLRLLTMMGLCKARVELACGVPEEKLNGSYLMDPSGMKKEVSAEVIRRELAYSMGSLIWMGTKLGMYPEQLVNDGMASYEEDKKEEV